MKIDDFIVKKLMPLEVGKAEVNVAQFKEIIKVLKNVLKNSVGIDLYEVIRKIK